MTDQNIKPLKLNTPHPPPPSLSFRKSLKVIVLSRRLDARAHRVNGSIIFVKKILVQDTKSQKECLLKNKTFLLVFIIFD